MLYQEENNKRSLCVAIYAMFGHWPKGKYLKQ